jgi:O-antigen ligase
VFAATFARHQVPLVYAGAAAVSISVGILVARSEDGVSMSMLVLVALTGIAVLASIPPKILFLSWLAVAPFLQASADDSELGRTLTWALYTAPALVMLGLTFVRRDRGVRAHWIDWLPGVYVIYVLASIVLTTDLLDSNMTGTAKAVVLFVAIGAIVYYFLTLGPGRAVRSETIIAVLLVSGIAQGVLAVLDSTIGWNVWRYDGWQHVSGGARAVSTLTNPALLGGFLGATMAIAVAVLVWDGPRTLKRLSWLTLVAAAPGLLLTLTRGPILATALVLVLLLLIGRARIVGLAVLAVGAIAIVLLLPSLRDTDVYRTRVADTVNIQGREVLQDWSFRLAAEKPVFGWGYGSFDRAKNTSGYSAEGVPIKNVLEYTSHNTYLTVLVELGGLGLLLFLGTFGFLGAQALVRARATFAYRWLAGATLGALFVLFLTASTIDFRFFSIAQMLPFLFLAILRRIAATEPQQP